VQIVATKALPRAWRIARITPLGELLTPPRLTATAIRLAVQIFLRVALWRGLYAATTTSAGLDREQAVTFVVLATLATRMRLMDRFSGRDAIIQHLQFGTIAYWFLRPVTARRYHALRALGDQLYGLAWVVVGYAICRALGVLNAPVSRHATMAFAVSALIGQLMLYRISLLTDLACFWTLRNNGALMVVTLAQNLLSGVYAPLWFFPRWFITLAAFLPFQYTLNAPLSLYIGRVPVSDSIRLVAIQLVWLIGLTVFTRWLWSRVPRRLAIQGG
jgi:ABC-2 type transport system permease protein